MNLDVLTKEDLQQFRTQLINDLKQLFDLSARNQEKAWLRGAEVRKLLQISQNTLQNLRVTGKLHPSKVGGILYYSSEEINRLLRQSTGK